MGKKIAGAKRDDTGYGSTYHKGRNLEESSEDNIRSVLAGQVWNVKPDKKADINYPCLWMSSGVVKFKNCNNFYDCTSCKYDSGMLKRVEKGKLISWQDAMRRRPALDRVCRHSLTQRIDKRACAYDYNCSDCDFDQLFEDVWTNKTRSMPTEMQQVKGYNVPMDYHFHEAHTWARIESGGNIRIGLDDFALKVLGQADAFDLPLMGKELDQGAVGWGLKRKENLADVRSPVGGVIMEVNSDVREKPHCANRDPYGQGWLFLVRNPSVKGTMKDLMRDANTLEWINGEVKQLEKMVEDVAGPLATDGGYFQEDMYGNLPALGWNNLTRAFLKT